MTLPLNCLRVLLITPLIDAEIKLVPQARRGVKESKKKGGYKIIIVNIWRVTALNVCSLSPPALSSANSVRQAGRRLQQSIHKRQVCVYL